ncbi:MAG: hypothetical protein IJW59_02385 [Clostridia bacterium]|nr:hypothetical protein [Clostridia bacterium]
MNIVSCKDRLSKMSIMDKKEVPQRVNKILKAELLYVLKNFFDISSEDICLEISVDKNRRYVLDVHMTSKNIKSIRSFAEV